MVSQVNPTGNCSLNLAGPSGPAGNASAGGSATLYLPVLGSPSTPVGGELDGSIAVFPHSGQALTTINVGDAQFSISLDLSFSTSGPVRSGFIVLSRNLTLGNGADAPDSERFNATLGSFNLSASQLGIGTGPPSPFTLGQNFLFHEDLAMQASGDSHAGVFESAIPHFQWTFTLFEADGLTPVQVSLATPEPRSLALSASGLLILFSSLLLRGRARWHPPA